MKFFTVIVSALSTLAAAAPAVTSTTTTDVAKRSTGEVVDKRAITFDLGLVNNFSGFQQVNLNYLLNINALQLNLLRSFAEINNFNVLQFQGLFQHQVFDLNSLLQLQALHTFLQIGQLGVLNGFDLAGLQLHFLNLGLLNNIGVIDLSQFIIPSVVGQVTSVARQILVTKE